MDGIKTAIGFTNLGQPGIIKLSIGPAYSIKLFH